MTTVRTLRRFAFLIWARIAALLLCCLAIGCQSNPLSVEESTAFKRLERHHIVIDRDGQGVTIDRKGHISKRWGDVGLQFAEVMAGIDAQARLIAAGKQKGPLRLLLFVHGGLNRYEDNLRRIAAYLGPASGQSVPLLAGSSYYPIFVSWNSSLADSIVDDLFYLRFGKRRPVLGLTTSPFLLLSRTAEALLQLPVSIAGDIVDDDRPGSLSPLRIATTPFVKALGTPAWEIMQQRAQLAVARTLVAEEPGARGGVHMLAAALLEKIGSGQTWSVPRQPFSWNDKEERVPVELTIVAHSMGAMIVNRLIAGNNPFGAGWRPKAVKRLVYLAPACSIEEAEGLLVPFLLANPEVEFRLASLAAEDELTESPSLLLPYGSLLVWIDSYFESSRIASQKTLGRVANWQRLYSQAVVGHAGPYHVMLPKGVVPPQRAPQALFLVADPARPGAPRRHGDFSDPRHLLQILCAIDAASVHEEHCTTSK